MSNEAIKLLDAIRIKYSDAIYDKSSKFADQFENDIAALREALAEQPAPVQQEPVTRIAKLEAELMRMQGRELKLQFALAEQPAPVPIGNRPREEDYTKLTSYIEALETYVDKKEQQWKAFEDYDCDAIDAMLAEKKALAEQPAPVALAQEPVAWTLTEELEKRETTTRAHLWFSDPVSCMWTPLYTSPPAQIKSLTDEQIQKIWDVAAGAIPGWSRHIAYARAIEAAHNIKEQP